MEPKQIIEAEDQRSSGTYHKRPVVLVRGAGTRVWDIDGREYLDCTAGIGVAALGHAHPVVIEALREQASRLITCQELFYNDQRAALFKRLDAVTPSSHSERQAFYRGSLASLQQSLSDPSLPGQT